MSKEAFMTPRGEIQWATISGQGKENLSGRLQYTVDIVCDPEDAQPAIDAIQKLWDENKPKGAKAPKSTGYKEDEDGRIRFTLKTDVTYPSGDQKTIKVYDAKAQLTTLEDKVGNGSTGRASGLASVYESGANKGVTLYLDALQVINLIPYTGGAAKFGQEDGDFVADTAGFQEEALI